MNGALVGDMAAAGPVWLLVVIVVMLATVITLNVVIVVRGKRDDCFLYCHGAIVACGIIGITAALMYM